MTQKLFNYWPIYLLIIATLVLRIVNLESLFYFTYDESVPAFVGRRLIIWNHIPLIGGVTPFGVHLTPYFYWLSTAILWAGNLNPVAWGWAGAVFSTATTLMILLVGNLLGNKKVGFTAAIFWTFSYLANIYDRHFWALFWGPLLSLIVVFSLYHLIKGNKKYIYLLIPALILGISADPSNLVLVFFSVIIWFLFKIPLSKTNVIAWLFVILSLAPLLVFDLRHNFANSKPFFEFWQKEENSFGLSQPNIVDNFLIFPHATTRLMYTFGTNETSIQYSYAPLLIEEKYNQIPLLFTLFSAVILVWFVLMFSKTKASTIQKLLALLFLIYFLGIQTYGTIFGADVFEHYISGLFPVFLLVLAFIVSRLPKKIWLIAISIFVATNLYKLVSSQNSHGLTFKRQAIEYSLKETAGKPFSLESLSTRWKYNGYRYLFAAYGTEPVKSYVDPNLAYLYGTTPVSEKHPNTVIAFVTHDFTSETEDFYRNYATYKSHEVSSNIFGSIEVIVMDNSSGWFDQN